MGWLEFREPINTWTHLVWMLLSVPGTWLLWVRSRGDRPKQISLLIFGVSLFVCFAGSTLYHAVRGSDLLILRFEQFDYMGIYLLIAGSSTPVVFNLLQGRWRWTILTLGWSLAAVGVITRLIFAVIPPWLYTSLYLSMGWMFIVCYFELARAVSHRSASWLVLGGVLYSIGAVVNFVGWPVLWRHVFQAHELFHLFSMAGSLAHFWFMLTVVVPYDRVAAERLALGDDALDESLAPEQIG
jgi:hemolysin III